MKVSYEGLQRYRNVDTGIDETLIDRRKHKTVPKEESTLYLEKLVPQTVYTFNITASFLDGWQGPVTSLRVETSAEGWQWSFMTNDHSRRGVLCYFISVCLSVRR